MCVLCNFREISVQICVLHNNESFDMGLTAYLNYAKFKRLSIPYCTRNSKWGGAHPKKNQKKPSQFTNFGVATGFFWFFFGFFWFFFCFFGIFWFFFVFFGFFWFFLG